MTAQGSEHHVPKHRAGIGLQCSASTQHRHLLAAFPVSQGCFEPCASREEPGWLLEATSRGPGSPTRSSTPSTPSTGWFRSLTHAESPPWPPTLLDGLHPSSSFLTCPSSFHQVFLHKYKSKEEKDAARSDKKSAFPKGHLSNQKLPYQNGHTGGLYSSSSSSSSPPAASSALCGSSSCDVSLMMMVGESDSVPPGRGICLDLAILDSAFLLSQVVPSLFMGSIVQFTQSVTAYMVSAAGLGLVAIYFATKVVFDKSDMAKYSV